MPALFDDPVAPKQALFDDPVAPEWQRQPQMTGQPAVVPDWQSLSNQAQQKSAAGMSPDAAFSQRLAVQDAYQRQYGGYVGPTAGQQMQTNMEQVGQDVQGQMAANLDPLQTAARSGLNKALQIGPAILQAVTPDDPELRQARQDVASVLETDPNRMASQVGGAVGGALPALAGGAGILAMTLESTGNFRNSVQEERARGVQISGQAEFAGAAASAANMAVTQMLTRGLLNKLGVGGAIQAIRPLVIRTLTHYAAQAGMGALDNAAMALVDNQINNAVLQHQRSAGEGVGPSALLGAVAGPLFDIHGRVGQAKAEGKPFSFIPEYQPRGEVPGQQAPPQPPGQPDMPMGAPGPEVGSATQAAPSDAAQVFKRPMPRRIHEQFGSEPDQEAIDLLDSLGRENQPPPVQAPMETSPVEQAPQIASQANPEPSAPPLNPRAQGIAEFIAAAEDAMKDTKGSERKDLQDKITMARLLLERAKAEPVDSVNQQESGGPPEAPQPLPEPAVSEGLQTRAPDAGANPGEPPPYAHWLNAPPAEEGMTLGQKVNPKDMFGREIIGKGTGEQQPMFHEPTQYQPPAQERIGSASANDPRHTAQMFQPPEKATGSAGSVTPAKSAGDTRPARMPDGRLNLEGTVAGRRNDRLARIRETKGSFTKQDIEARIGERYAAEHQDRLSGHDEEQLAPYGAGAFTFHRKLPEEVTTFLSGRSHLKRLFRVTNDATKAYGADAFGDLGENYWRIAESLGTKGDSVEWAAKHPDPELQMLAKLHEIVTKGPKEVIDPAEQPAGTKFSIGGHEFEISAGEEGEHRMLRDGADFDPLPADMVGKLPADKGSLERPSTEDAPFSPLDTAMARSRQDAGEPITQDWLNKYKPGTKLVDRPPKVLAAAAKAFAAATGRDVVFFSHDQLAGFADPVRDRVFMNVRQPLKSFVGTLAHEWMHGLEQVHPGAYRAVLEAIPAKLRDSLLKGYQARYKRATGKELPAERFDSEVAADAMKDASRRRSVMNALMGKDPTLWDHVVDAAQSLFTKLQGKSPLIDAALKAIEFEKMGRESGTRDRAGANLPESPLPAPIPGKQDEPSTWEKIGEKARATIDGLNRLSGKQFPSMTRLARETGEAASRYAASVPYSLNATPAIARRVLGHLEGMPDMNGVEPRRVMGALLTQDKLDWVRQKWNERADLADKMEKEHPDLFGGTDAGAEFRQHAEDVHTLIGAKDSPFETQQDFEDALNNPKMKAALKAWDEWFKSGPDKDYQIAQRIDPELLEGNARGLRTGIQVNMKAIDPNAEEKPIAPVVSRQGNLTNPRLRKSQFAREAKGTGEGYETDPEQLIANTLRGGYEIARLHELYGQMVKDGVAKVGKPGQKLAGYVPLEIESAKRFVNRNPAGETKGFTLPPKMLYVKAAAMPELRNALNVDSPDLAKTINKFAKPFNVLTLASFREAAYHLGNGLTMFSKPGTGLVFNKLAGHIWKMAVGSPEIGERIAELARIGAAREPAKKPNWNPFTWTSKLLDVFDKAGRLMLDDAFTGMAAKGLVKNTETNRRDFISQMGNYNKRAQSMLVRAGRESGIAPFATAGTNYLAQAIRMHALSPGVTATSTGASIRLRAEVAGRLLLPLVGVAVANYLRWGKVDGASNIPLGALRLDDDEKGRPRYIDIASIEGVTRALRASGSLPWLDKLLRGDRGANSADNSAKMAMQSFASPLMGPPARALSTAITGKDIPGIGRQKAEKANPGESQFAQNAKAAGIASNPIAEYVHGLWTGQAEVGDIGQELGRFGVKHAFGPERTNAESMMGNLQRERFGDSQMTPEQSTRRGLVDQYVDRVRKEGYKPVSDALAAGTLTAADEQAIRQKLDAPSAIIDKFKGLTALDAVKVWKDAATDAEKRELGTYLLSKIDKSKTINEAQRRAMMQDVQREFDRVSQGGGQK